MRIVDPETGTENPAGQVGEIWVHGDNVAKGYWQKPKETQRVFGGRLVNPSTGTPEGPWLRTGDLGVISDGELFIIGRIKDLLIVDGSNHYPDDIEATIQEISKGRCRRHLDHGRADGAARRHRRGQEARRLRRGAHPEAAHAEARDHLGDIECPPTARCRSRLRAARFASDHHQRESPPVVMCRALPEK